LLPTGNEGMDIWPLTFCSNFGNQYAQEGPFVPHPLWDICMKKK
jgi:hypothetical protein